MLLSASVTGEEIHPAGNAAALPLKLVSIGDKVSTALSYADKIRLQQLH